MPIVKASLAGFCFGVKRAVDMINEIIERDSGEVYTLGHLIHNPVFNTRLAERGVINISNDEINELLENAEYKNIEIKKDLNGIARAVSGIKGE